MKTLKFYFLLAILAIISACENDPYEFTDNSTSSIITTEKIFGKFDVKFTERTSFSDKWEFEVDMHGTGQLNDLPAMLEMNHIQNSIKNSAMDTVSYGQLFLLDKQTGSEIVGEYGGLTETTKNGAIRHFNAEIVRGSRAFSNTTGEIWVSLCEKNDQLFVCEVSGYICKKKQVK